MLDWETIEISDDLLERLSLEVDRDECNVNVDCSNYDCSECETDMVTLFVPRLAAELLKRHRDAYPMRYTDVLVPFHHIELLGYFQLNSEVFWKISSTTNCCAVGLCLRTGTEFVIAKDAHVYPLKMVKDPVFTRGYS